MIVSWRRVIRRRRRCEQLTYFDVHSAKVTLSDALSEHVQKCHSIKRPFLLIGGVEPGAEDAARQDGLYMPFADIKRPLA